MRKFYFIIIIFGIILYSGLWFLNNKSNINQESQSLTQAKSASQLSNLESQSNSDGAVTVTVTPVNFSDKEWNFNIVLNTHSEELTTDLTKDAILLDDKNNEYLPSEWQSDPPGGHHRNGTLKFKSVSPLPESITLKILGVGGIEERIFTWPLK